MQKSQVYIFAMHVLKKPKFLESSQDVQNFCTVTKRGTIVQSGFATFTKLQELSKSVQKSMALCQCHKSIYLVRKCSNNRFYCFIHDCFCPFESNINYSGTVEVSDTFEIRKVGQRSDHVHLCQDPSAQLDWCK